MRALATGDLVFRCPNALIVWVVIGAGAVFLLNRTTFGRSVYGIGNRERAAYLSGVDPRGLCSPLSRSRVAFLRSAAFFWRVMPSKAAQGMGDAYLLPAIASVVLGGASILGGRGGYVGDRRGDPDYAAAGCSAR